MLSRKDACNMQMLRHSISHAVENMMYLVTYIPLDPAPVLPWPEKKTAASAATAAAIEAAGQCNLQFNMQSLQYDTESAT